jgi:hypothetical protein
MIKPLLCGKLFRRFHQLLTEEVELGPNLVEQTHDDVAHDEKHN